MIPCLDVYVSHEAYSSHKILIACRKDLPFEPTKKCLQLFFQRREVPGLT